jgi:hypothetical protein
LNLSIFSKYVTFTYWFCSCILLKRHECIQLSCLLLGQPP